jgi:hypothetical protein
MAVPPSENAHGPALPVVRQFSVLPANVPSPDPDTATPTHVAVYAIAAVVAPVGVTE